MDDTAHRNAGGTRSPSATGKATDSAKPAKAPEWAAGLKRLYDSVVEEPLPDDLASLLARLDEVDGGDAA